MEKRKSFEERAKFHKERYERFLSRFASSEEAEREERLHPNFAYSHGFCAFVDFQALRDLWPWYRVRSMPCQFGGGFASASLCWDVEHK